MGWHAVACASALRDVACAHATRAASSELADDGPRATGWPSGTDDACDCVELPDISRRFHVGCRCGGCGAAG